MRRVGISQRIDFKPNRSEYRDALDQKLIAFIKTSGFLPIPIPNKLSMNSDTSKRREELIGWVRELDLSAFILSGGNDLLENKERDDNENWLLDFAEKGNLPVLGICRGMQVLGTRSGGVLEPINDHSNKVHEVTGQISGVVNSFHKFAFKKMPNDYNLLASANDGCIEAIEHKSLPWEGWMWHPERFKTFRRYDIERLNSVFNGQA